MDLKHPVKGITGNKAVKDIHPLEKMGETSLLEIVDDIQEQKGKVSSSVSKNKGDKSLGEIGKESICSENETLKNSLQHRKATIIVAGRARNGKSTALKNVFQYMLTATTSATFVTEVVQVSEVTKIIPLPIHKQKETDGIDGNKYILRVIDTPGLRLMDIPKERIIKDMKNIVQGEDYTLIYCISVSPYCGVTEIDENIVKYLQQSLGKEVWNKCVLLFTFSDKAYYDLDNSEEYIECIKDHATEFQKILNKIDPTNSIVVKTIFDYQSPEELELDANPSEIIAIPVDKVLKRSKYILPGMLRKGQDWTEIVFIELMKKTPEEKHIPFVFFRYPDVLLGGSIAGIGSRSGVGAIVGATIGATVGAAMPLGIIGGASVGAVMGAAAGTVTGFFYKQKKEMT